MVTIKQLFNTLHVIILTFYYQCWINREMICEYRGLKPLGIHKNELNVLLYKTTQSLVIWTSGCLTYSPNLDR